MRLWTGLIDTKALLAKIVADLSPHINEPAKVLSAINKLTASMSEQVGTAVLKGVVKHLRKVLTSIIDPSDDFATFIHEFVISTILPR